ncbi:SPOR domain-containing protein [Pseudoalteromonas sp. ASV78]|uniref:SPOR domain-containing protein n=1 Tax=Pseudoalteromonas sp. ASV78 TaxID=3397851 RepID=UPI0039FC3A65
MNIKQSFSVIQSAVLIVSLSILSGCSSTMNSAQKSTRNTAETNHQPYVQITQQELQQLQTSSAQWQAIKPDLERLLLIESDLKLLITQLTAIANEEASQSSPQPQQVSSAKPADTTSVLPSDTKNALFALQIIAVTQQSQLAPSWQAIQQKAPSLLSDKFITNVETAQVKGMTYYRLKIGAYQYQKNAQADCDKLKLQQLNCMVTHYTDHPVKL